MAMWCGFYEGGLNWPRDSDRLPNGNTLIVDSRNGRVIEIDSEGKITWSFEGLRLPYDADMLPDGKVIISDSGNSRVIIVDRDGRTLFELKASDFSPLWSRYRIIFIARVLI